MPLEMPDREYNLWERSEEAPKTVVDTFVDPEVT